MKFLAFFSFHYDCNDNAVDISQMLYRPKEAKQCLQTKMIEVFYQGHSIVLKSDLTQLLQRKLMNSEYLAKINGTKAQLQDLQEYIQSNFLNQIHNYKYFVLDPFNHAYCPGKNVRFTVEKSRNFQYPDVFEDLLGELLKMRMNNPED